jgi:lysophospholipase L1-like esterase
MFKTLTAAVCPALLGVAFLSSTPAAAAGVHWARSWAASAEAPLPAAAGFPPGPTFRDQTIRQVVRLSGGGRQVRIRISNEFGTTPLRIGDAHIASAGEGGAIGPGSDRRLTFAGASTAVIPPGAPILSDPVRMPVQALSSLSISLYLPEKLETCTCHATSMQTAYVLAGDEAGAAAMPGATKLQTRALISAVEVGSDAPAGTIVALGDSITDGVGSSVDANRRWPDLLAERLVRRAVGVVDVANEGISGNRILNDGFGLSALARFDRDVLSTPGLRYVIVFEGVNDIGISHAKRGEGPLAGFMKAYGGEPVTAEDMILAYKQMIARAHAHGVRIYGATIAPFEGAATWTPEGEAERQAVNAWIRSGGGFDAVLDFDAAIRDPDHPSRIRDGFHMGDHLHGSDAGYQAIADSIDLGLFR